MVTELQPLFVAQEFANKIPLIEVLWRYDLGNMRHYRRKNGETFKSLTTFISAVESTPEILQGWRESMLEELGSIEKVDAFVDSTATYGTMGHEALAMIAREGSVDWARLMEWAREALSAQGMTGKTLSLACGTLRDDTATFMQFIHDYKVRILAVELPVWLPDGIATLIDFVVEKDVMLYVDTPMEKRKRHVCIINYKTGRKGFFESHALQLEGEKRMFNHVYGPTFGEIHNVYNLAPTNWKDVPAYKIKDQTKVLQADDKRLMRLFQNYLDRAKIEGILGEPKTKFKSLEGVTFLGDSPMGNLKFKNYSEFVQTLATSKND